MGDGWLDSAGPWSEYDPERAIADEERYHYHEVDGVLITGRDYPSCLDTDDLDCDRCRFFDEDECRLRRSAASREAMWEIIAPWVPRSHRYRRQREALRDALVCELAGHGRELHYHILDEMVAERHPGLQPTDVSVLWVLRTFPDTFDQVAPGVYRLRHLPVGSRRSASR